MIIEPNCNLPWEIYLDWLSDQGFDDLRNIDPHCFISGNYHFGGNYNDYMDFGLSAICIATGDSLNHRYGDSNQISYVGDNFSSMYFWCGSPEGF